MKQTDSCQRGWDGMKDGEGINQRTFMNNLLTWGHGRQCGDWLGLGRWWDWVEVGKERKSGNSINNKENVF